MYRAPVRYPAPKALAITASFLFKRLSTIPDDVLRTRNESAYADLVRMRERFQRLKRKVLINCAKDESLISLELCLAKCEVIGCRSLNVDSLMGKNDSKGELFSDIIKLQRLVNILYHGHDDGKEEERDTTSA